MTYQVDWNTLHRYPNKPPLDSARPLITDLKGWRRWFAKVAVSVFERGLNSINCQLWDACEYNPQAYVMDCGTGDGQLFFWLQKKICAGEYLLLDAERRYNFITPCSLEDSLPVRSDSVDAIICSQVIEHIIDTPNFLYHACRALKVGGYMVVTTENLASWPNIGCLLLGWFPFSLTNCFGPAIGNPLVWHASLNRPDHLADLHAKRWGVIGHQRVFTPRALRNLCEKAGFTVDKVLGSRHSHFIGLKLRKLP